MYETYWDLADKPFRNTTEPKFLYPSSQHEEATARLKYGIDSALGCIVLSGVFGCGKTLLLKSLFLELEKGKYDIVFVPNPQMNPLELLSSITYNLGIDEEIPENKAEFLKRIDKAVLNNYNDGKHTIVVVDEAHVINSKDTFEELRMLLNFQREEKFLITLILSGQPEINTKINNIKQLAQRVGIKAHLDRMNLKDTTEYIKHRIEVAGGTNKIFTKNACEVIFNNSGGIPRRINSICDLSLLTGFTQKVEQIGEDIVTEVVGDLI
ncbi:MAG: ExeA family protein [Elusimicrobiota bacterium]